MGAGPKTCGDQKKFEKNLAADKHEAELERLMDDPLKASMGSPKK